MGLAKTQCQCFLKRASRFLSGLANKSPNLLLATRMGTQGVRHRSIASFSWELRGDRGPRAPPSPLSRLMQAELLRILDLRGTTSGRWEPSAVFLGPKQRQQHLRTITGFPGGLPLKQPQNTDSAQKQTWVPWPELLQCQVKGVQPGRNVRLTQQWLRCVCARGFCQESKKITCWEKIYLYIYVYIYIY